MTRPTTAYLLLVVALWTTAAAASQTSERLVAQAEVAYQEQRYEDARALYAKAAADDPGDAAAQYGLGLAMGRLSRWPEAVAAFERATALHPGFAEAQEGLALARTHLAAGTGPQALEPTRQAGGGNENEEAVPSTEAPARRAWAVHAMTGVQYDSNVTIAPSGEPIPGTTHGDRGDTAFLFGAGGRYDLLDDPNLLLRLEYDIYQTVHVHLGDFDFQSHRIRTTGGYALTPSIWAGVQGGYEYYLLGYDSYMNEPYVNPFVSFIEHEWGLTQLSYRHGQDTYMSKPFHDLRDGPVDTFGLIQTLYDGPRYLSAGFEFGLEHPTHSSQISAPLPAPQQGQLQPSDYDNQSYQAHIGGGFPAWWKTNVDLSYLFRYEDYSRPNSRAGFRKTRADSGNHMYASLTRPITDVLSVAVAYYGTVNLSNIQDFEYRRNVASLVLQVAF
jgi:hypothetical protein